MYTYFIHTFSVAYSQITLKTLIFVLSQKLNSINPIQYLDRGLLGTQDTVSNLLQSEIYFNFKNPQRVDKP